MLIFLIGLVNCFGLCDTRFLTGRDASAGCSGRYDHPVQSALSEGPLDCPTVEAARWAIRPPVQAAHW